MADAEDLKSSGDFSSCGFDSHPGHHSFLLKMNELLGRSFPRTPGVPYFAKEPAIAAPGVSQIRFQLFLSRAHPWCVVLLGDSHALVAQQNRDSFDGNSSQKQFNSERVAEAMRMSIRNICEFEESAQSRLPAPHDAFELSSSAPEEKFLCDFWRCFQRR